MDRSTYSAVRLRFTAMSDRLQLAIDFYCGTTRLGGVLFDLGSYIGPAVIAALVSGVISIVSLLLSSRTARHMHQEKLNFDERLSERKAQAELALIERKMTVDISLAEKRFAYDQSLVAWKRRFDLAEQTLAASYEARDVLNTSRNRLILSGEGKSRKASEPEGDVLRQARDSAYVPIERLMSNLKSFSTLDSLQDVVAAHFGIATANSVRELLARQQRFISTASFLVESASDTPYGIASGPSVEMWHNDLYGSRPDKHDRTIEAAIAEIERTCKPILDTTSIKALNQEAGGSPS